MGTILFVMLLLGGLAALGYYMYTKNKSSGSGTPPAAPVTP